MGWNLFKRIDGDTRDAFNSVLPSTVDVRIHKEPDGGYSAIVLDNRGNVVTQGKTGQELFEMVNDAVLESYNVPEQYKMSVRRYMPPEDALEELKITIPDKYLDQSLQLVKS